MWESEYEILVHKENTAEENKKKKTQHSLFSRTQVFVQTKKKKKKYCDASTEYVVG